MAMHRVRYRVHLGCQLSLELPNPSILMGRELILIDADLATLYDLEDSIVVATATFLRV
jgi:hypothetical protein